MTIGIIEREKCGVFDDRNMIYSVALHRLGIYPEDEKAGELLLMLRAAYAAGYQEMHGKVLSLGFQTHADKDYGVILAEDALTKREAKT